MIMVNNTKTAADAFSNSTVVGVRYVLINNKGGHTVVRVITEFGDEVEFCIHYGEYVYVVG